MASNSSNDVFVLDYNNKKIRKIDSTLSVSTLAGSGSSGLTDGIGTLASFSFTSGILQMTIDSNGNLYIFDNFELIRKITSLGAVTTVAKITRFSDAQYGMAIDSSGNIFFTEGYAIRKVTFQ